MDLTLILGIVSIIGSLAAVLIAILRRPHEVKNLDADTVKKYAEAASSSADRAHDTAVELEEYRKNSEAKIKSLEDKITELEAYKAENESLRNWSERLVHQVISLGGIPVPMKLANVKK